MYHQITYLLDYAYFHKVAFYARTENSHACAQNPLSYILVLSLKEKNKQIESF